MTDLQRRLTHCSTISVSRHISEWCYLQAEELLRRNGEYQAMVTDLQRRLNDARSQAEEAADATRRELQRVLVLFFHTSAV